MLKLRQLFKSKYEDRAWKAEEKLMWWEEHVRWFSPSYPVLVDISDRIQAGNREMMVSRSELVEKYGDGGLSLAELILLNNTLREAAVMDGGWSNCQLNSGNVIPFFFSHEAGHLFNTERYSKVCKMRIPRITIHVASEKLIPIFESAIKNLYSKRKLPPFTYSAPHFKFNHVNCGLTKSTIEVKNITLVQPFQHLYFQG